MTRWTALVSLVALLAATPAFAACPAGQSEMLTVRLYFGQQMGGKPIASSAWRNFLARSVTPRFPDGFTVFEAAGQWRDPRTQAITREPSKVVEIIAPDTKRLARPRRGIAPGLRRALPPAIGGIADIAGLRNFLNTNKMQVPCGSAAFLFDGTGTIS